MIKIKESWKPIPDYENLYQISKLGRVKSLVGWNGREYIQRDKIISPFKQKCANEAEYRLVIKLTKDKKRTDFKVDKLVDDLFN